MEGGPNVEVDGGGPDGQVVVEQIRRKPGGAYIVVGCGHCASADQGALGQQLDRRARTAPENVCKANNAVLMDFASDTKISRDQTGR